MQCFSYEGTEDQPRAAHQERKKNEDINEAGISPAEAFAKFAGKSVDYKTAAVVSEAPSPAFVSSYVAESPQDRYKILKAAIAQFRAELQTLPKDGEMAQLLIKETAALEASLEDMVKDAKLSAKFNDPLAQPTELSKTSAQLLAQLKQPESKSPAPPPAAGAGAKPAPPPPAGGTGVTYELYLQQDQKAGNAVDLSAIEKRVHQLEQSIGIGDAGVFSDLQSGIVHLRRKLAILENPRELEAIMRKAHNLLAELETLEEQKSQIPGAKSTAQDRVIHSLYKVVPEWDAAGHQLPGIVARLQSIKVLCEQGAVARGTLSDLQTEQAQMDALLLSNQTTYVKLVGELTASMKNMEASVNTLEKSIAAIAAKKK